MKYTPLACQKESTERVVGKPKSGLIVRMGVGKTVSILTAVEELIYNRLKVNRVLVVAPKRVALMTWPDEIAKWDHTSRLTYTILHGKYKDDRLRSSAFSVDITLINYEGLRWLWENRAIRPQYDMMVFDESTYLKNAKSERSEIARDMVRLTPLVVIMTGTFRPNSIENIWSQMFMIDRGQRLGTTITHFRDRYMIPQAPGAPRTKRLPLPGAKTQVLDKIKDLVLVVEDTQGVGLPDVKDNIIKLELPVKAMALYKKLIKDGVADIDGETLTIKNTQSETHKLRQLASGFLYMEGGSKLIHKVKLEALRDICDNTSENVMVAIQYKYEVDMIRKYFGYRVPAIYSPTVSSEGNKWIRDWMVGKVPIFIVHPASMSHGLNLQGGGQDIVWFSLTWDLEHWLQLIARLRRRGSVYQTVFNHVLLMIDTVDETLLKMVTEKDLDQEAAMKYLRDWYLSLKKGRNDTYSNKRYKVQPHNKEEVRYTNGV